MKEIYFSDLSLEELESLCRNANDELLRRREHEKKKDWDKVVTVLKDYIKKYGEIEMDCEGDGDFCLDSEADFSEIGSIRPAFYY